MAGFEFFKKEMREIVKTQKIFILPALFLFVAFSSPLASKYINEILKMVGVDATFPEPKFTDSYLQFFKNFNSMCFFIMVLSFMGIVVDERVRGSMVIALTKRLSRTQFIFSKFISVVLFYTASYFVSVVGCIYYTYLLFPNYYHENLFLSFFIFWIYGVFIISVTVLGSTISKTHMMSGIIGIGALLGFPLIAMIPRVGKYTPGKLSELSTKIISGTNQASDTIIPLAVTAIAVCVIMFLSVFAFKRQEI